MPSSQLTWPKTTDLMNSPSPKNEHSYMKRHKENTYIAVVFMLVMCLRIHSNQSQK